MKKWALLAIAFIAVALYAENTAGAGSIVDRMPNLVMQLGIVIFAARIGSLLVEKIGIPGVLGELLMGVLIGPYLLGGLPLPGFPFGMFGNASAGFPLQPELYGIAIIASIVLLFLSGLETDLNLFLRFSFAGAVVGLGGIVFSFLFGAWVGMFFLHAPLMDPKCLFLGVMSTATSVGITAHILSERRKMDTPEGVTILAGAVIDDVLGVVLLAIVLGIAVLERAGGSAHLNWEHIGLIAFKEIGIWLGVTMIGLYFAKRIGGFLKGFKNRFVFSILAFSLALVIAGLFERAGLAMIIGAYVVGLTLSKTEISFAIQEAMHPIKLFFVPVFFTVMGMLVNLHSFLSVQTLLFGGVYLITAILAKFLGCGLPSLALGFNRTGAIRIGLGMIPRGEVALIIAGIGLSYGFLDDPQYNLFGIAILMTLVTTLVSPPLLNRALRGEKKGVRPGMNLPEKETISFHFDDRELSELMVHRILLQFQSVGFFINRVDQESRDFQIRRENLFVSLYHEPHEIRFQTERENLLFVQRMVHEAAFFLKQKVSGIVNLAAMHLSDSEQDGSGDELADLLPVSHIVPVLKGESKDGLVWELLQTALGHPGVNEKVKDIYHLVMAREHYLSGGLTNGLAIPHAHTNEVDRPLVALGVRREGIDFGAVDEKPSHLIVLILTPEAEGDLHIRLLSGISQLARNRKLLAALNQIDDPAEMREKILAAVAKGME
jgi:Kef-type K+ transport system membrane component KefB/mannitol/fructose-specific phosphotransferase system IIA component (Ntr-type)